MISLKDKVQAISLFIKCYFIILVFGLILPKVIDFILKTFLNKFTIYKNSVFVFNVLSKNEMILYRYIYIVNKFFNL